MWGLGVWVLWFVVVCVLFRCVLPGCVMGLGFCFVLGLGFELVYFTFGLGDFV